MGKSEFESERLLGKSLLLTLLLSAAGVFLWTLAADPTVPALSLTGGMLLLTVAPFARSRGLRLALGVLSLLLMGASVAANR